jgi:hypothetical protein
MVPRVCMERDRVRWEKVLSTYPAIAQAWNAWRCAGNPPAGLAQIAEAAIAAGVPWAEGQPFDRARWLRWAGLVDNRDTQGVLPPGNSP